MLCPGDIRDMHQAVHTFGQAHEHSEIGYAPHFTGNLLSLFISVRDKLPGAWLQLLEGEREAALVLVSL